MAKLNNSWSNVNSERDIINALVWCRWILQILGVWPLVYTDTSTIEKILATLSFTLCWSALSFLLIPMVIFTLSEHRTEDKLKILGPLNYVLTSMLKYFFLVMRRENIRRSIRVLSTDWRAVQQEDHRKIMIKNAAKSHVLSKFCIMFMYSGGLSFHTVLPFLSPAMTLNEQNVTVRPIPYPGYDVIFDLQFMPTYVFVFCGQWFGSIVLFNVTTAVCCLASMFVAHACGQIETVMARVESFVKGTQGDRMKQRMAVIVKHHVQSLRFSVSIDSIFREIYLVEVVGTTFTICVLEYDCLTEWRNNDSIAILTYLFLLISFTFNVFILCYIGEQLTNQCSKVGYTSYGIEWYHLSGKVALDLTLIISISHFPVKITAGKIINLSFSSFGNVLKTSIAYLNLLRTFV